jgi:hypothetical protein
MTPVSKAVPAKSPGLRLDPFVFPSETRGRFQMLVIAALLVGLNAGFLVEQKISGAPSSQESKKEFSDRVAAVTGNRNLRELSKQEIEVLSGKLSTLIRERLWSRTPHLLLPGLFMLAFLVFAAGIYLDHPRRFSRRHRTRPLSAEEAPEIVGYLQRCIRNLGLLPFELQYKDSFGLGANAQTFGFRGREVLLFHGAPSLLERSWGNTARAVALHEVGHIVNADAQDREKCKAIWIALLCSLSLALCVLVPHGEALLQVGWRLAAMLLLIRLIWLQLVRIREFYADRRVAFWGLEDALERRLRLPDPKDRPWERFGWWTAAWERWGQRDGWERLMRALEWLAEISNPIWKSHPSNRLRREVLADPGRLFRVSSDLPFVAGVLLSILLVNLFLPMVEIFSDVALLMSFSVWKNIPSVTTVAIVNLGGPLCFFSLVLGAISYLVAKILAVQVHREAIGDLATGNPRKWGYAALWKPSLLLALGVAAGLLITPFNSSFIFSLQVELMVLWLIGLTCLTWLWLAYVRALARFTIGMETGSHPPRRLHGLFIQLPAALLTVLYWPAGFALLAYPISLLTSSARPPISDPREHFAYMIVMTGAMLAIFVLAVYVLWAGLSLATVAIRLRRREERCLCCGDPLPRGFAVGRSCASCGEPLAPWACEPPVLDPAA